MTNDGIPFSIGKKIDISSSLYKKKSRYKMDKVSIKMKTRYIHSTGLQNNRLQIPFLRKTHQGWRMSVFTGLVLLCTKIVTVWL